MNLKLLSWVDRRNEWRAMLSQMEDDVSVEGMEFVASIEERLGTKPNLCCT